MLNSQANRGPLGKPVIPTRNRNAAKTNHSSQHASVPEGRVSSVDLRESLANEGAIDPITKVSLPEDNITKLRGIMLDIDPAQLRKQSDKGRTHRGPEEFYEGQVRDMLSRHPVLAKAEVRVSGSGLHVLLWFDAPIEFQNAGQREYWSAIVRVVQRLLPTDPHAPGMTILTRPIGSVNSKNGVKVRVLAPGTPVTPAEIVALYKQVRDSPVRTITRILLGCETIEPCPICRKKGTSLAALDHFAKCYGSCGQVKLSAVYDLLMDGPNKLRDHKHHAE